MADDVRDAKAVSPVITVDAEAVVVGLGALGAATTMALAQDGVEVVGLEQFELGHALGASHGRSRALRALYDDPLYVGLVRASVPLWRDLEAASGEALLRMCGGLYWAAPGNVLLERCRKVALDVGLGFETLDPAEVARRFSALQIPRGSMATFVAETGFLDADRCVAAMLRAAIDAGAQVRDRAAVRRIDLDGPRPLVITDSMTYRANRLVIAAGAWAKELLPGLALPLKVTRQGFFTFRPEVAGSTPGGRFGPDRMPVYCDYDRLLYGFPDHGPGLKVADDNPGPETTPETIDRSIDPAERGRLTNWLESLFPDATFTEIEAGTCFYTLTPDHDFILGPHPARSDVLLGVGLDHGFKFSILFGRILADLVRHGRTGHPIDRFRVDRFVPAAAG